MIPVVVDTLTPLTTSCCPHSFLMEPIDQSPLREARRWSDPESVIAVQLFTLAPGEQRTWFKAWETEFWPVPDTY